MSRPDGRPRSASGWGTTPAGSRGPYDLIKAAILTGEFEPGRPLTEVSLAQWADVSRTPIREALRRLEQDGLVARVAQGLVVRSRSQDEILDLYDTRIVLEARAAEVAAERRTDHDLRLLRWALDRGEAAETRHIAALVEANERFHEALWRASHNESLIDLLGRLSLHLARYPGTTLSAPGRWEAALLEHADLVNAIERREGERAHRLAAQHFGAARDVRLQLFAAEAAGQPAELS